MNPDREKSAGIVLGVVLILVIFVALRALLAGSSPSSPSSAPVFTPRPTVAEDTPTTRCLGVAAAPAGVKLLGGIGARAQDWILAHPGSEIDPAGIGINAPGGHRGVCFSPGWVTYVSEHLSIPASESEAIAGLANDIEIPLDAVKVSGPTVLRGMCSELRFHSAQLAAVSLATSPGPGAETGNFVVTLENSGPSYDPRAITTIYIDLDTASGC